MQNVRNSRNAYIFKEHYNDMMMMMATATTALVDFFLTLSLLYLSDLCDKIRFWMCFIGELLRLKKLKHKVDQKKSGSFKGGSPEGLSGSWISLV